MQVDNLRPEDVEKFEKVWEEVVEKNPEARMHLFQGSDHRFYERCLFKQKCQKDGQR